MIRAKTVTAKILWLALALCVLTNAENSIAAAKDSHTASAGWAEVDITPPLGIALGGRGGPETLAGSIHDPLFAQVLYMKDAKGSGMVLVSFDMIGIPHELSHRIRKAIVQELGVEYDLVVLNCSHTHSGPYMIRDLMAGVGPAPQAEIDYFNTLTTKIISAARTAAKALTPVTVQVLEGKSQMAINRRGQNQKGDWGIIPNPDGPIAEKIWVLKLTPNNGQPPAVVFSYACHPVIVYGFSFAAISADFPGVTRNVLREKLGGKAHVQFVQGTAGDVRPRIVADLEQRRFRASKPADLQQAGEQLAADVMSALNGKCTVLDLDLVGTMDRPFLPRSTPPAREIYEQMAKETNAFHQAVARYWLPKYDSGEGFARGDACPVGLIRLAENQWVAYTAGEPCVEWAPKVAKWLAPHKLVMWGYTQEALSYIPTESLLPQGGYEVIDSNRMHASTPAPYAPGIEDAVRKSLLRQAAFISAKVK